MASDDKSMDILHDVSDVGGDNGAGSVVDVVEAPAPDTAPLSSKASTTPPPPATPKPAAAVAHAALPKPSRVGPSPLQLRWTHCDHTYVWITVMACVGYTLRVFLFPLSAYPSTGLPSYSATLANIFGSIIMGYVFQLKAYYTDHKWLISALGTGVCGCMTTFSTWISDSFVFVDRKSGFFSPISFCLCLFNGAAHGIMGVKLGGILGSIITSFVSQRATNVTERSAETAAEAVPTGTERLDHESDEAYRSRMRTLRTVQRDRAREQRLRLEREIRAVKELRRAQLTAWDGGKGRYLTPDEVRSLSVPASERVPAPMVSFSLHLLLFCTLLAGAAVFLPSAYYGGLDIFPRDLGDQALGGWLFGLPMAIIGAEARYLLRYLNDNRFMPFGTLIANMAGVACMGSMLLWEDKAAPWIVFAFKQGLCGSLSTLSSFAVECITLQPLWSSIYFVVSLAGAFTIMAIFHSIA